ncbi:MAG: hypothetical protein PWP10_2489 [Clostridiales bacterium]|jgi:uncharacterized membrane protein (DUF485 family)|nr:DUF2752 domain-containing protein [Eubacteriales bacterium]MDD3502964.1 DUF2752 domain-containing protein [Eubacteriales bacterium]MDN5313743.1 hypothetical protein [Clostridiales bacterium]
MSRKPDPYENDPFPRLLIVWGIPAALIAAASILFFRDPGTEGLIPCAFYQMTGIYCTGCGTTRAFHALLHGRVFEALSFNLFMMVWVWLVVYTLLAYWLRRLLRRPVLPAIRDWRWLIVAVLASALVFLILRNIPVWPLSWLAP